MPVVDEARAMVVYNTRVGVGRAARARLSLPTAFYLWVNYNHFAENKIITPFVNLLDHTDHLFDGMQEYSA